MDKAMVPATTEEAVQAINAYFTDSVELDWATISIEPKDSRSFTLRMIETVVVSTRIWRDFESYYICQVYQGEALMAASRLVFTPKVMSEAEFRLPYKSIYTYKIERR